MNNFVSENVRNLGIEPNRVGRRNQNRLKNEDFLTACRSPEGIACI